jgi:hypothetical protein
MQSSAFPQEIQKRVHQRTGWRIRNLVIEVEEGHAILHGQATSYHSRQLAQQVVRDLMPDLQVKNSIHVDYETEVLLGMPLN